MKPYQTGKEPIQSASDIDLSVIVVSGNRAFEKSRPFSALMSQTILSRMELILLNADPAALEIKNNLPETGFPVHRLSMKKGESILAARCRGFEKSSGHFVAIIEDHCVPDPNWGKCLIENLSKNDGLAGYAYTNGSPERYGYRSIFLAEYGCWMYPIVEEQVKYLPNNNIAFRRQFIQTLQDQHRLKPTNIFAFSPALREFGVSFSVATEARVDHQSYRDMMDTFRAHFHFSRWLGGTRFKQGRWRRVKRFLYGFAVPILLPPLRMLRTVSVVGRSPKTLFLVFIPGVPLIYGLFQFSAIGEMIGYFFGKGQSAQLLDEIELNGPRIGKVS